ncbi:hypothetical protein [Bacillus thuringiensis]|uniref:hypothetical protein n=1 Tax=Bacillus thuringiensis TaxID=1428 RepID=UPI000BF79772|nr:hypothetical protein [Bacillus thuringiensis]PFC28469.1 hypothetical protein CN299_19555 [Bacillus thuringiensis]
MKFLMRDIRELLLSENEWKGLKLIQKGQWIQGQKSQYQEIIFQHENKFYRYIQEREGSSFTDWYYLLHEDIEGCVECEEVEGVNVITKQWKRVEG